MSSRRKALTRKDYVAGIQQSDRSILGRTITLIESNAPEHIGLAQDVLSELMPLTGQSIRIGITGIPGAGKSTLIEALGLHLVEAGHRVAVLAVDPTSGLSGGSILGDKTRMEQLSRSPDSFIRPSPSGGALGGVARKTRESMLVCEAAGYDVILIETVGVGQSEVSVRSLVDFFLLLQIPGGGDELQGIKRGIIEIADAILINKADGDNVQRARAARSEFEMAIHYLMPVTTGWQTRVRTCSALTGEGIPELWQTIQRFKDITVRNGFFQRRRSEQARTWMRTILQDQVMHLFLASPRIKTLAEKLEAQVVADRLPPTHAARQLIEAFEEQWSGETPDRVKNRTR